jgi:hypothetical protein
MAEAHTDAGEHKPGTLHFQQFVARQYWRKHWATRYRFRAYVVQNGAFSRGAYWPLRINCNHRHMLRH